MKAERWEWAGHWLLSLFLLSCTGVKWSRADAAPLLQEPPGAPADSAQIEQLQQWMRAPEHSQLEVALAASASTNALLERAALQLLALLDAAEARARLAQLPVDEMRADALLTHAGRLTQQGRRRAAGKLLLRIYEADLISDSQRHAALAGLLHLAPARAAQVLPAALAAPRAADRLAAARVAALLPPVHLKRVLAAAPDFAASALCQALAETAAKAGLAFARHSLQDAEAQVQAITALGAIGERGDLALLATLLDSERAGVPEAAAASLTRLKGRGVEEQLVELLAAADTPGSIAALMAVAAKRKLTRAAPLLVPFLGDRRPEIRLAALQALRQLAQASQTGEILALLPQCATAAEERAVEHLLTHLGRNFPAELSASLTNPRSWAEFNALALASRPEGLKLLAARLPEDEIVRLLANTWKTPDAIPLLLEQARNHPSESLRIIARRGIKRLKGEADE